MPKLLLPQALEKFRKEIEQTIRPTIKITTLAKKPTLFQSKFAGDPYLPKTHEHPKDEHGKYMKLLAQINFAELPHEILDDMPKRGMLQFFLSGDDDVMGLDFDEQTKQKNFRVIYHEEIVKEDEVITDFSYIDRFEDEYFPIDQELSLAFSVAYEAVSVADYSFNHFFKHIDLEEMIGKDDDGYEITLLDLYAESLGNDGHKIGGYAFFTQFDPREDSKEYEEHDILLLQIDSDDDNGILWGDCGVGNFFIKRKDLKNRDFSNILYNWDCH